MNDLSCPVANVSQSRRKPTRSGILALTFAAIVALAGCTSPPVNQTVSFDESDFKSYQTPGTAVIQGHAFVRSDTGVKHGAAGIQITLVPLTAYTEERAHIMESRRDPAPADPRLEPYVKTVVGDWGGDYKFEGLPAGKYLIFCKVEWERQNPNNMNRSGSGEFYALARTQVKNGEHKSVVVTNLGQK